MCFSVQGEPYFTFNLINDKYVKLNAQFVLPAKEESHTISNVSTLLGNLGLLLRCPITGNTKTILVSAEDRTIKVGDFVTTVHKKALVVDIKGKLLQVLVSINPNEDPHKPTDESPCLHVNTDLGFALNIKFYKKHLNMFIANSTGLTENAHGLIG